MQIIRASERQSFGRGPFQIRRLQPGRRLGNASDLGFGPLGLIDHAQLGAGLLVPMHEHRNDEILSYLHSGTLWHEDTHGGRLPMSPTQLALMKAGSGISHEETIPDDGQPVEMLQIFTRPSIKDLPPQFQTASFDEKDKRNAWRSIAGPPGSEAPLHVRNQVWVFDRASLSERFKLDADTRLDQFLYLFKGMAVVNGESVSASDSIMQLAGSKTFEITADGTTDWVLFKVDRDSAFTRAGTLSG